MLRAAIAAIAMLVVPCIAGGQERIENESTKAFGEWLSSPSISVHVEAFDEQSRAGIATVPLAGKTGALLEIELDENEIALAREGKLKIELFPARLAYAIARVRDGKDYEAVSAEDIPTILADPSRTTICGHRKLLVDMPTGDASTRMIGIGAIVLPLPTPTPVLHSVCIIGAAFDCPRASCMLPVPRLPVTAASAPDAWGHSATDFAAPSSSILSGHCKVSNLSRHPRLPLPLRLCGCEW